METEQQKIRRWEHEFFCWAAANPSENKGFYHFLREVKEIPYRILNLMGIGADIDNR